MRNPSNYFFEAVSHQQAGRLADAERIYRRLLISDSNNKFILNNLGVIVREGEGELFFRRALDIDPTYTEAYNNLGAALVAQGRMDEAIGAYQFALRFNPNYVDAIINLGIALHLQGKQEQAALNFDRALSIEPGRADIKNSLISTLRSIGLPLVEQGKPEEALGYFKRLVSVDPDNLEAYLHLGAIYSFLGSSESIACYEQALRLCPQVDNVLNVMMGSRPDDFYSLAALARTHHPNDPALWWYSLFSMLFTERDTPEEIAAQTVEWAHQHMPAPLPLTPPVFPEPGRRVRVGYVASSLHFMFLGHLPHHDFNRFDIHVFTNDPRVRPAHFGPQVVIHHLGEGDLGERLRRERLDVAIEMMGPSFHPKWLGIDGVRALSERIAPVQCHWIATTGTYGIPNFGYVLADDFLIPQELECLYAEKIWRLPDIAHCWRPSSGDIATEPPVVRNGFLTFGSANRGIKMPEKQLDRFAQVVAVVPASKMILKGSHTMDSLFRARATSIFSGHGIAEDRLSFELSTAPPSFPASFYSRIDISLDTYPYAGGITTLESLWMGVPVVTRLGRGFVSRVSSDYLRIIGRSGWIADSDEDYVAIAASLAMDHEELKSARRELRPSLAASPLLDCYRFAHTLEAAFLEMLDARSNEEGLR